MKRTDRGRLNEIAGKVAEDRVADDYVMRGGKVLHRRWRGKSGEIDLIVSEGGTIVFVEVKQSASFESAAAHLSERQITRIIGAAEEFLAKRPNGALSDVRIDVALANEQGELKILRAAIGP